MDSKRRMIEIHIFDDRGLGDLTEAHYIVFYFFVICKCDNVGIYQHNQRLAEFHCGGPIDLKRFVKAMNKGRNQITLLDDNTIWIKNFIQDTWGTIAAGNNLGLSCYKLLVKHNLLERFIQEYPNNINIKSFREAILENSKGYGDLPLPQGSPSPDPRNSDSEEYEGQTSPKAGTINISINDNKSISIDTLFEGLKKAIPIPLNEYPDHVYLGDIERLAEQLKDEGVKNIEAYLIQAAKNFDWENSDWEGFAESLIKNEDVPF